MLQERVGLYFNPERLHLKPVANVHWLGKQDRDSGVLASLGMSRERLESARNMTGGHHDAARIHNETRSDNVRNPVIWAEPQSGGDGKRRKRNDTAVHDGGSFGQIHKTNPAARIVNGLPPV